MRFCFVTTFYPPYNFGGDGIAVQRLARALVKRGHHVTVVHDVDAYLALSGGVEPLGTHGDDAVEVIALKSRAGIISPILSQQLGRPTLHRRRFRQILDDGRYDVINFHNPSLAGGPGVFSYGGDATRLMTAHDHWLVCPTHVLWRHKREPCPARQCFRCQLRYHRPPQWWRMTGLLERQLEHIDVFIAMSEFSRTKHYEFGFPREMEVLPFLLPDPVPGEGEVGERPHQRPYFIFVGRLEKIKGLQHVIPLFREYPNADLLVAGDGTYADELVRLSGDSERVKLVGRIPADSLARYYTHAIATIVPSVCFETFGIVIVESFRYRTPVIARNIGPFPETIAQSGGGELFQTDEELLASMSRLQSDWAYRNHLGAHGYRAYVSTWSESAVVPRYLEIVARARARRELNSA
ncbi:MAG TPA: glycosyltransferase family 4 protein [Gemmatimonadaceae bacterium]|nr:glycosyltransferase family 4 protein [Gemmatimonadaceae bacterium]